MATSYPVLSPRGELSMALKQVWPGYFRLKRERHGFGVTLSHAALQGTVTMKIDDNEFRQDLGTIVRHLTRWAWACLLAYADAQGSGLEEAALRLQLGVPVRLQAEVKRRPLPGIARGP
jgi:hypothetical protein